MHDANSELQLANFMEAMFGPLRILKDEDHEHGFFLAGAFLFFWDDLKGVDFVEIFGVQ